jgi:hypothetical protein
MKKLLLASTAALGLAVSAGAANATLTYTVWRALLQTSDCSA